jgi:biopolymer transport protein ExbD
MDSHVKGHHGRTITTPGYHILPKFDLVHFRHFIEERKRRKFNFNLSLAPMVDMFSILVIYLIMNFSTTGEAFFVSKDIVIPQASKGQALKSFPLVSIVKDKVTFEMDNFSGRPFFITEVNDENVPQLRAMLKRVKAMQDQVIGETELAGKVNIQADKSIPVEEVKKVLRVLIDEGWSGINFVVDPTGKKFNQ